MDKKITEMYAFIRTETDGQEGVLAFKTADGWMPMTGADITRVKSLIPLADALAKAGNKSYRIKKFTNMVDITEEMKK